jgi:hypothetical protein
MMPTPDTQDLQVRLLLAILGLTVMLVGLYRWMT